MIRTQRFQKPLLQSVTVAVIVSATIQAAYAQQAASTPTASTTASAINTEEAGGLEEIIVTAQKVRENINDVGMSINALSGDDLSRLGITSPDQLTKTVPGLNITKSGYGLPVYTMRGVGYYDVVPGSSPAVSLYMDEVPLTYPIMARGAAYDIQRVEVLKGPQGTLFGQNATGGLVNYIANRPTDVFTAGVATSYGTYDRFNMNGYVSGPITDTLSMRVSANVDRGGDWQRSPTRDDSFGESRFYAGRVLLDWKPTDRLSVQFNGNGWVDKSDEQPGQLIALATAPSRITPVLRNTFNAYAPPDNSRTADWDVIPAAGFTDPFTGRTYHDFRNDDNFFQLGLRAEYELTDNVRLTSVTAKNKVNQSNYVDVDGTNQSIYSVTSLAHIDVFSQELRLSGTNGGFQWVFGGNYAHDDVDNWGSAYNVIGTQPFRGAGTQAFLRVNTKAVFAHLDYALTEQLKLVSGVRYTEVGLFNVGCTLDPLDGNNGAGSLAGAVSRAAQIAGFGTVVIPDGGCATLSLTTHQPGWVTGRLDEHNVPYNIGLNWKVADDSLLYVSVGRGFKAGSYSPNGAVFESSLDPAVQEKVQAVEAGFKLGLADNHLQFNGAAFHYDYDNKQVRGKIVDVVLGAVSKLINVPTSRIRGAELQAIFVPTSRWRFNAGVTYVDSQITGSFFNFTASGLAQKELAGEALPLTPKWQGQADAEFNMPVFAGLTGFLGSHYQYQGRTFGGLGEEDMFRINSYGLLDVRTGVRAPDDRWSVSLFVNNVTDKYSWNAVNASGPDAVIRMTNQPRTYGVRGNVRF